MNASGEFLIPSSSRNLFGLRVCDLGWTATLGLVESLLAMPGNQTVLSFLDETATLRQAIDPGYRLSLRRRLMLPGGSRSFGLLSKLVNASMPPVRFEPKTFVPALLTFLEKPRRIGILVEDKPRGETLREQFSRHAPWHEFVAIAADTEENFDFVIVAAGNRREEKRSERRLSSLRAGLVIMTGTGLAALNAPKRVSEAANVRNIAGNTSFA